MKNFNIISILSALTMLASVAAMPVSAANTDAYSVSYETLTQQVVVEDGTVVPAGAVAVTVSVEGNTGFNNKTLALQVDDGYEVMVDQNGSPVTTLGKALKGFDAESAVSENKVCIASAAAFNTDTDGDLFTVYAIKTDSAVAENAVAVITQPEEEVMPISLYAKGRIGDVNNDSTINSVDAAEIFSVVGERGVINYPNLEANLQYFKTIFPNTPGPDGVNCFDSDACIQDFNLYGIDSRVVDRADGQEILCYAAYHGVGQSYTGQEGGEGYVGKIY